MVEKPFKVGSDSCQDLVKGTCVSVLTVNTRNPDDVLLYCWDNGAHLAFEPPKTAHVDLR